MNATVQNQTNYKSLNKELHFLLAKANMMGEKASLVKYFTVGRTASSSDMKESEMRMMIDHLKRSNVSDEISRKAMAKKIIHLLCKRDVYFQTASGSPDMTKINGFIKDKWKKDTVWKLTLEELRRIIGVIENRFK